jgi:hypothetical protein
MAKYRVSMQTVATTVVEIEVPDDVTDHEEIATRAAEEGEFPTICGQCAGWGRGYSLDMGDEWNVSEYEGKPLVERTDA